MIRTMALSSALLLGGVSSGAATLTVDVVGLRNEAGLLRVAVCPRAQFTKSDCPHVAEAPASAGRAVVEGVPPGIYAVQAFHDEDGDGDLDRRGWRPSEGLGFSRDAPMRMGPPRFSDAAVQVEGDGRLTVMMRYYGR
jgi:uncharacterized protein (DUF2141 family)